MIDWFASSNSKFHFFLNLEKEKVLWHFRSLSDKIHKILLNSNSIINTKKLKFAINFFYIFIILIQERSDSGPGRSPCISSPSRRLWSISGPCQGGGPPRHIWTRSHSSGSQVVHSFIYSIFILSFIHIFLSFIPTSSIQLFDHYYTARLTLSYSCFVSFDPIFLAI